jgi:hypothetical protein
MSIDTPRRHSIMLARLVADTAAHHAKVAHGHHLHATERHEHATKKHAERHG